MGIGSVDALPCQRRDNCILDEAGIRIASLVAPVLNTNLAHRSAWATSIRDRRPIIYEDRDMLGGATERMGMVSRLIQSMSEQYR